MRCRDAKVYIAAQRDGDLVEPDVSSLQEHLKQCSECHAFEQRLSSLDSMLCSPASRTRVHVSTEHIMLAVEQRRRISQQLEDIHQQQQSRVERLRSVAAGLAALIFFTLGSIPLLLLAITIIQSDLVVKAVSSPFIVVIDMLFISGKYLQEGLTWATRNNMLLSAMAFAFVLMMVFWLRLMRYPREV